MNLVNSNPLKFLLAAFTVCSCLFVACKKDNNSNDPEFITTVKLTFSKTGSSPLTFTAKDLDGTGSNPPVSDEIVLAPLAQYSLSIQLLDESDAANVHDVTTEVNEEKIAHLVCFSLGAAFASQTITDFDNLGNPLGLLSNIMTGPAGTGTFGVALKHQPDKAAATACSTGETDVDVSFPVKVE